MFEFISLDVDNTTQRRTLNWVSDCLVIRNNSPYPLYINWRTTTIPNTISYDELVPGGMWIVLAAKGDNFGFFLDTRGSPIPAIGKKCGIIIQAEEIIPTFSQANWRSSFTDNLSLVTVATKSYDIPVVGSLGMLFDIELVGNTTSSSIRVEIYVSDDGLTFRPIKYFKILTGFVLSRILPSTTNYVRILIRNLDITSTSTILVTYSLLQFFSAPPIHYRTAQPVTTPATLNSGSSLTMSAVDTTGSQIIDELYIYFEPPSATPNTFNILVELTFDGSVGATAFTLMSNPPNAAAGQLSVGSFNSELIHRRINEWGYRIKANIEIGFFWTFKITNNSGLNLGNVSIGARLRQEI